MRDKLESRLGAASLLAVRLAVAAVFIYAGWKKLIDIDAAIRGFDAIGIVTPWLFAPLVAVAEFFGGIGLAVGILPRFSAAVLTIVMAQATWTVFDLGRPFMPNIALNIVLGACVLSIALGGAGPATVPQMFHRPWLDIESLVGRRAGRAG